MPPPRGRLSYQGDPEAAGINLAKRTAAYTGEVQRENERAARNNAMNALGKNVPASALPSGGIHKNMSQADQDAAVRAIQAYNGTTPAAAHMPGPTHMAPNVPQLRGGDTPAAPAGRAVAVPPTFDKDGNLKEAPANPGATSTAQTGLNGAFRGSTADEVKEFYATKPGSATSPAAVATAANAGAGNTVQTPFGTASSTDSKKGAGTTWQEQIVSKHPEIGVKDSDANKAFLDAYSKAKDAGGTIDPHAIAAQVQKDQDFRKEQDAREPGASYALNPNGENAATAIPSGFDTGAPPKVSQSTATQIGKAVHDAPGKVAGAVGDVVGGAINKTVGAAKDLYAGLTGNKQPVQDPNAPTPAQVAGNAAMTALNATGHAIIDPIKAGVNYAFNSGVTKPGVAPSASPTAPATAGAYTGTPAAPTTQPGAAPTPSIQPSGSPVQDLVNQTRPGSSGVAYAGNGSQNPIQDTIDAAKKNKTGAFAYSGDASAQQSDPHADIHAATVNAITNAGQNAHNAVNSSSPAAQPYTGSASPSTSTPAPQKQTADF